MSQTAAEDDDFEYEVEAPDEEVTRHQQRRAAEQIEAAKKLIDVDAVYRDLQPGSVRELIPDSVRPRFSIKSILLATTAVAAVLGVAGSGALSGGVLAVFICLVLVALGAAHAWLNYQEHQRQQQAIARRREELRASRAGVAPPEDDDEEEADDQPPTPAELLAALLRMSPVEWGGAIVVGLVVAGLLAFAPSLAAAAGSMAAAAIIGAALIAADVAVPRLLVVAWGIALVGMLVVRFVGLLV